MAAQTEGLNLNMVSEAGDLDLHSDLHSGAPPPPPPPSDHGKGPLSGLVFPKIAGSFNIASSFSTKMTKETYRIWRLQFLDVLAVHEISYVIEPEFLPPPPPFNNGSPSAEYATWNRLNRLVLSWLRATLSDDAQFTIMQCTTAPEAWLLLERCLAPTTKAYISSLTKKLRTLEKTSSLSMTEYLMSAKRAADALAAAGEPIADSALFDYITDGLKEEYQSFLSLIELRPPSSFDDLFHLLINEEALLQRLRPKPIVTDALYAHRPPNNHSWNSGRQHNSNWRSSGRGRNSNRRGRNPHRWQQSNPRQPHQPPSHLPPLLPIPAAINPSDSCQLCLRPGHTARTCSQRNNYAYSASLPGQLGSMSISDPVDNNWILDSGASQHMARSPQSLTDVSSSSGQNDGTNSAYWSQP